VIRRAKRFVFAAVASVGGLVACAATAPDPTTAQVPSRSLGLALKPGPCVAGGNVVSASAFVAGADARYLEPSDGELRLTLVLDGAQPRPVTLHWLDVSRAPMDAQLLDLQWNLELQFDSPRAGECPLRVEFEPSRESAARGLGRAVTTVVLKDAPAPPWPVGSRNRP